MNTNGSGIDEMARRGELRENFSFSLPDVSVPSSGGRVTTCRFIFTHKGILGALQGSTAVSDRESPRKKKRRAAQHVAS